MFARIKISCITYILRNTHQKAVSLNFIILGLQPRDKAAMLGVKTKEYFLEEFT